MAPAVATQGRVLRPLTPAWTRLRPVPEQIRLKRSQARFRVVAAGRRGGKSTIGKRWVAEGAMRPFQHLPDDIYPLMAPVRDQAKRLFWEETKQLIPQWAMVKRPSETDLSIRLWNGATIIVVGMDRPDRIEGLTIRRFLFDEYALAKPSAWPSTVRPMCSTAGREGEGMFTGRPKGRNHFYDLFKAAQARAVEDAESGNPPAWDAFHWTSEDVLTVEELIEAQRDLDLLSYEQEYLARFINFEGRVYYGFDAGIHATERIPYDPDRPLIVAFDFNVSPGVAVYMQEIPYQGQHADRAANVTAIIGEVWIENDSNTPAVCRRILADFGRNGRICQRADGHPGDVLIYGDATGGARKTSSERGSDWNIVRQDLRPEFGSRLKMRVPKANPNERARVNSVNRRLMTADGTVSMIVDPVMAPHVVNDFEGVAWKRGEVDVIDKATDSKLTHCSDGLGYYLVRRWPVAGTAMADQIL